jgi:hypothetical protein
MLLEELWRDLIPEERIYFLKIAREIQANPTKASPSDCSMFITNMTLCLFVRIAIYYKVPTKARHQKNYNEFLQQIASKPNLPTNRQLITKSMVKALDPELSQILFQSDGDVSPSTLFKYQV